MDKNHLYYGDNLEVLRRSIPSESVDLVYLDPPFNSARNYNVIFSRSGGGTKHQADASAQIEAFEDTWTWTHVTDQQYEEYVNGGLPPKVADALSAMRTLLGENDATAYLVNMAPRLVELHRVLRSTGSLYLHCDPTMSHYLKMLLDAVFDPRNFKSEIIWKRTKAHNSAKRFGPVHDVILFYTKSSAYTWNRTLQAYDESYTSGKFKWRDERGEYQDVSLTGPGTRTGDSGKPWRDIDPTKAGRHWQPPSMLYEYYEELTGKNIAHLSMQERLEAADEAGLIHWPAKSDGTPRFKQYLHISQGVPVQDVINDIDALNSQAAERLGYPTQKPLALLERIINASSNPGDVVLDPFCGCGTTVDSAQKLGRKWVGIDITYIAIDLIEKRLLNTYGKDIEGTYVVSGIPHDKGAAYALFKKNPFDFERWAVAMVGAQPNAKQVGDKGIDGVAKFPLGMKNEVGRILVSVKGGKQINPAMVRDLVGTVQSQKAEMGVLILLESPTKGMTDAINHAGTYTHPANGQVFPKIQMITVPELLGGKRPNLPPTYLPYIAAQRMAPSHEAQTLWE